MSPPEKSPGLSGSAPPRAPLTDIELLVTLDRMRRSIEAIEDRLKKAESNDERFTKLEHDFRIVRWLTTLAVGATFVALINGVAGRFSWRTDPAPPVPSNAERLGSDRVQHDQPRGP